MKKSLYMLHIPKCGGLSISLIKKVLPREINVYPNDRFDDFTDFENYDYVHWHFGSTPVDNPDYDTVCIVRDPVDRAISNFLWLKQQNALIESSQYLDDVDFLNQLKYYLFEDENYFSHRNLQARFLSNEVSNDILEAVYKKIPNEKYSIDDVVPLLSKPIRMRDWYIEDNNTSFENAVATLDKCISYQTLENHSVLLERIFTWFKENRDIDVKNSYEEMYSNLLEVREIPYYNYSSYTDSSNATYTTTQVRQLLSAEEINEIYNLNSIDKQIYDYVKDNSK
jgi:hypothetical protein